MRGLRAWLACHLFGLLALAAAPAPAQAPAVPSGATQASARQGFAWIARKGEQRLLLLATIHAAPADLRSLPADIGDWLTEAKALALEADVSDANAVQALVQRHGLIDPASPDLWQQLDAPLRERVQARLRLLGTPPDAVARLKPWLLAVMLATSELARAGFDPASGSELRLAALAREHKRPIFELEGSDAQMRMFDRTPPPVQRQYLDHTVDSLADGTAMRDLQQIVQAWRSRDADAMDAVVQRMHEQASKDEAHRLLADTLLRQRHPPMLDAIESLVARHSPLMVAAGAAHWFGPGSLIEGLRSRGWDLTPR